VSIATTANGVAATGGGRTTEEWVRAFVEGWRAPTDAESFADHFDDLMTDDVRLIQPQVATAVGRRAFREQFARPVFELIPDLHATVHRWAADGDTVLIEFTLTGTLGRRPVSWDCVDRVTLRDGLATERHAYFDPTPLLAAIATRPGAWPRFARLQARQVRRRIGIGGGS
jgi:ketosteroid isomerase-like protein